MAKKSNYKPKNTAKTAETKSNEQKTKTKKVALYILLILFAFWSIGSALGIASFFGANVTHTAYADSVSTSYTFQGSNLTFQTTSVSMETGFPYNTSSDNYTSNFKFSFTGFNDVVENSYKTEIVFTTGYWEQKWSSYDIYYVPMTGETDSFELLTDGALTIEQETTNNDTILHNKALIYDLYCTHTTNAGVVKVYAFCRMYVSYSNQSYFDSNVVKVELGNESINTIELYEDYFKGSSNVDTFPYGQMYYNFVRYIDNDGDYIEFQLPVRTNTNFKPQFLYDSRTYYLTQNNDASSSDLFLQGYNDGVADGITQGREEGFTQGENFAKEVWYRQGYNDGVASGEDYSFTALLGSIIDAPIIALFGNTAEVNGQLVRINGLLNFELLGINLSVFLGGLLTASLIIAVIKLIL